jgi:hypothetical protein
VSDNPIDELSKTADVPMGEAENQEEAKKFRTPGFQRMRLDWKSDDRDILNRAKVTSETRLLREFPEAYRLIARVYDIVREPVYDEFGNAVKDARGLTVWKTSPLGGYEEDFSRLGIRQKEDFLFAITTHLFEWQQLAADAWGEAMFAKAQWEERFSIGFDAPVSGTVDDRTAAGRLDSREERYFAIFMSMYSRKVDSLIRSLELLNQRIKDSLSS